MTQCVCPAWATGIEDTTLFQRHRRRQAFDWKKPETKRKNLIRLGVEQGMAYAWSRTRMGGWAVAQSPILITTVTLSRLRRIGYESMLSYYLKTQPQIR